MFDLLLPVDYFLHVVGLHHAFYAYHVPATRKQKQEEKMVQMGKKNQIHYFAPLLRYSIYRGFIIYDFIYDFNFSPYVIISCLHM